MGTVSALRETIDEFRQSMYELAKKKGISDPRVIKISQQLDGKIIMLQNIIYHSQSLSTAKTLYYDENKIEPNSLTEIINSKP